MMLLISLLLLGFLYYIILKIYIYLYNTNKYKHSHKMTYNHSQIYLFSYGSNSIEQLKKRLSRIDNFVYYPAYINNYTRIFAGNSKRWDGGIASIYPCDKSKVYGIAVEVTQTELEVLDLYEGGYNRSIMKGYNQKLKKEEDYYVYIKQNNKFYTFPSDEYLEAIDKMLNDRNSNIDTDQRRILIKGIINNKLVTLGTWMFNNRIFRKFH